MTIYGETDEQFRPRPSNLALLTASLSMVMLAVVLTSFLTGSIRLLPAALSKDSAPLVLYAPVADDSAITMRGGDTPQHYTPIAIATASLLLALLFPFILPTAQRLSSRLFVHMAGLTLATFGCVAVSLGEAMGGRAIPDLPGGNSLFFLLAAAGAVVIFLVEKKANELLAMVYSMDTPSFRVSRWLLRIPLPFGLLGGFSYLNGYLPGVFASIATIVVTFFENLRTVPAQRWEELGSPEMREAAASLAFVAPLIVAGSLWLFGSDALHRPPHAIVAGSGKLQRLPIDAIPGVRTRPGAEPAEPEKKIEMRFSRDRKGAKPPRPRPAP